MKHLQRIISGLLGIALLAAFALAQEPDKKAECEKWLKTNNDTHNLVKGVIDEVEKAKPTGQAAKDLKDAKDWFDKAQKKRDECKAKMDKGEYTDEVVKDLGWAWQWYIKAGTMAVNAKLGLPSMKKGREKKEEKK